MTRSPATAALLALASVRQAELREVPLLLSFPLEAT